MDSDAHSFRPAVWALLILRKRVGLLVLALGTGVLTSCVMLLIPNVFIGRAVILPPTPQHAGGISGALAQSDAAATLATSALRIRSMSELYGGMLQSRTISDEIIERFDLRKRYPKETMVETRKALAQRTSVVVGRDGLVQIEYEDEDPQFAADVANAYVEALENLSSKLAITDAAQRRLFLEKQIGGVQKSLAEAEAALIKVQVATGLFLPEQAQATILAASAIRAQVVAKEVEVASLESFATSRHPDLVKSRRELSELRGQLGKIETSQGKSDVLVALSRLPDTGMAYLAKLRDLKYNERLFELLARQLEIARLDEAREGSTIQVIERAVAHDRKSRPYRTLWVLAVTLFLTVSACLYLIVVFELENGSNSDRIVLSELRAELRRLLTRSGVFHPGRDKPVP